MMYRAAAALPWSDRDRAVAGLRGQLRVMAVAARATPDWKTLVVDGPSEVVEPRGGTLYEWRGEVRVEGGDLAELPADDTELLPCGPEDTMPHATLLRAVRADPDVLARAGDEIASPGQETAGT
jgi:hypothetical protein